MKKILVAIDFSKYSFAALQTARRICTKNQAKIVCISVIPSPLDWDSLSEKAQSMHQDLIERQNETIEVLPEYIKSVVPAKSQIEQIVKIGVPHEQILKAVDRLAADVVVIGAFGTGYSPGNIVGSTLQHVIRLSPCPVLAVKKTLDGNAFRKIAFASVFNPAAKTAFKKILPLARIFKSSIHLLYINTQEHFTTSAQSDEDMAEFCKGHEQFVIHRHVYNDADAERGIIGFCEKNNIHLVGIATGRHLHHSTYLLGTTETLIFKSELGVLSLQS